MSALAKPGRLVRIRSESPLSALPAELPHRSNRHKGLEAAVGHRLLERPDLAGRI